MATVMDGAGATMRKLTDDQVRELSALAALRQPQGLLSTETARAVLETLALYGERLECARASVESLLIEGWLA